MIITADMLGAAIESSTRENKIRLNNEREKILGTKREKKDANEKAIAGYHESMTSSI